MTDLLGCFSEREDYHQSLPYAKVMEATGWTVIPVDGMHLFLKQVGPVCFAKLQRPTVLNIEHLKALKRKLHIVRFYIEPALTILIRSNDTEEEISFDAANTQRYILK